MRLLLAYILWKSLGVGTNQNFYQIFTLMKFRIGNGTCSIVYEIDKKVDEDDRYKN
jgi:hypothetical protein|tara:strand:+ start:39 stop:206 length:168 start_codon:yes stop_codon:yes gene_type:complete